MNDPRFALCQSLKNPGFTALACRSGAPASAQRTSRRRQAVLTESLDSAVSRSIRPIDTNFLVGAPPPNDQSRRHRPNHRAHSFRFAVESRVAKEAADKMRGLVLTDGQDYQAILRVAERAFGQTQIVGKKRRSRQGQQEGKNLIVGHALAAQFHANLPDRHAPASQQLALALQNVFVQDDHVPSSLRGHFIRVVSERLSSRAHRFGNGFFGDAPTPFFHNAFPRQAGGDLFQHVCHQNAGAAKRGLPVANLRVTHDVTPNKFFSHAVSTNTPTQWAGQRSFFQPS